MVSGPTQGLVIDNVPVVLQFITLLTRFWIAILNRLIPMADQESSDSLQTKLFLDCSQAMQTKDLNVIAKYLHKDFHNVSYPRSLGKPEQTKEEWLEEWAGILSLWTGEPDVSYIGCSPDPPSPRLSSFRSSITSVSSQAHREKSSFMFVSKTSGSTAFAYVAWYLPAGEQQGEELSRG